MQTCPLYKREILSHLAKSVSTRRLNVCFAQAKLRYVIAGKKVLKQKTNIYRRS